jgi:hypothetical protein
MSDFEDEFEAAHEEFERVVEETWQLNGTQWPAVDIDDVSADLLATFGGKFRDVTTSIIVRKFVYEQSGVTFQSVVIVDGEKLRVETIKKSGDGTVTLICGPSAIKPPKVPRG